MCSNYGGSTILQITFPFMKCNDTVSTLANCAGTDGPCLDTCKEPALLSLCNMKRQRGAACNQNRGYCDVFHRCRIVDENGPLARLQQLLVPNRVRELIKVSRALLRKRHTLVDNTCRDLRSSLACSQATAAPDLNALRRTIKQKRNTATQLYRCTRHG